MGSYVHRGYEGNQETDCHYQEDNADEDQTLLQSSPPRPKRRPEKYHKLVK